MTGSYLLPNHRLSVHRGFFPLPLPISKSKVLPNVASGPPYAAIGYVPIHSQIKLLSL